MDINKVFITFDAEASVWMAESDDVPGLVLEDESLDKLIGRVNVAAPELLELNCGYTDDVYLSYIVLHNERLLANG